MTPSDFARVLTAIIFAGLWATTATAQPADPSAPDRGGIITLYPLDPLASTFSFRDGRYGHAFEKRGVANRESDIDFSGYARDAFSVGIEGARLGVILDLGTSAELAKAYGYREAGSGGLGFASLRRDGQKVLIRTDQGRPFVPELQPLAERANDDLFGTGKPTANAPVKLGHVYLVRLTDAHDKTYDRVAKLLVISHRPHESVTVRWAAME